MGKLHLGLMQFDFSHSIAAHDSLSARIALTLGRRSFPHYAAFSSVLWDKHRTCVNRQMLSDRYAAEAVFEDCLQRAFPRGKGDPDSEQGTAPELFL